MAAHFQTGNVLNLTWHASNSFDIVLDGHCFHCIIGPDRAQFLREAFRVLKPAGVREEASQAAFIVLGSCILPRRNDREMDLHPAGCDETLKAPPRALSQSEDLRLVYGRVGAELV